MAELKDISEFTKASEVTGDEKIPINAEEYVDLNQIKEFAGGGEAPDIDLSNYVQNDDARLSDSRPASDVSAWAKEDSKPTYGWTEINGKPTWIGANKPTYSASEVGALPSDTPIPSTDGLATEQFVENKTAYASESARGTARIWTTTEDGELILNISTED